MHVDHEDERQIIYLIDARSSFEFALVCQHINKETGIPENQLRMLRIGGRGRNSRADLGALLTEFGDKGEELWLQPVRAIWRTPGTVAKDNSLVSDFFSTFLYKPGRLRQRMISRFSPEKVRITKSRGAFLDEIRERFRDTWGAEGVQENRLPEFIFRQAMISLDRQERAIRGARYKIPRLLVGDITANPGFQRRLGAVAGIQGQSLSRVEAESRRYLKEMSATQTPFSLDMMIGLQRRACRSGHDDKIDYIPEQLEKMRQWIDDSSVVLLVTHKSMLDTMAVSTLFFDHNIPVPLTFGGINLNTPGLGQLATRSGVIFLRRAFQDNAIYKATFRRYVDYLVEKRFSLMWALEGRRSRTGKLLPPRYGLMNYVAESILRTRLHSLRFVPVSVTYDQITEVDDYVAEQRGIEKKPEGADWLMRFLKRKQSHGRIYVRFGDAVTATDIMPEEKMTETLAPADKKMLVEQIALRSAVRLNAATPITLTSLLTLILLANGPRGRTLQGLSRTVYSWMERVRARNIPIAGQAELSTPGDIAETLAALEASDIVTRHELKTGPVFQVNSGQYHKAAYYRNTVIHFFVTDAIIELSLLYASEQPDSELAFWREVLTLRDLLKFEFYFETREAFLHEVREKLVERDPAWEERLQEGATGVRELLTRSDPLVAQGVLRSFIDAYQVAADVLVHKGAALAENKKTFLADCMELGLQSYLLRRVFSEESVSIPLYETAFQLAEHRGLLTGSSQTIFEERNAFAEQVRSVNRRLDVLLGITLSRQTD